MYFQNCSEVFRILAIFYQVIREEATACRKDADVHPCENIMEESEEMGHVNHSPSLLVFNLPRAGLNN